MKRWIFLLLAAVAAAAVLWVATRRAAPPEVPFARVQRGTLVSVLATNGKTEPQDWAPVHAARAGRVVKVEVQEGAEVRAGQVLAVLSSEDAASAVATGEARVQQAKAELAVLQKGGRAAEIALIDGSTRKLEMERESAARAAAGLQRLVEKQAAPRVELEAARDRMAQIDSQLATERSRRGAMVMDADLSAARAKIAEAEAALGQAQKRLEEGTVRAPRAGVVFDLPARAGAWAGEGELIAKVGDVSRLKVTVHVDEPDLGKIREGLPVTITWDAMPDREWSGRVLQPPSQVVALGTRMVGEVISVVENPTRDLPPGANINARIRAQQVENAVTIPKSALRREGNELGVFVLSGGRLKWVKITLGTSSETQAEVRAGVAAGDAVALPTDRELQPGLAVTPVYP